MAWLFRSVLIPTADRPAVATGTEAIAASAWRRGSRTTLLIPLTIDCRETLNMAGLLRTLHATRVGRTGL
jgi:hypothetical protein